MITKDEKQLSKLFNKVPIAARFLALLAMIGLLMTPSIYAQNRSAGEIRGTVTDTTGAVIPGAAVTIQNTLTGVITKLTSDSNGVYDAVSLDPGTYAITFAKEGFKEYIKTNVILYAEAMTANAVLEVGSVTQRVEVKAGVELVQTETSDKRVTLTTDTIAELPSVGQNWMDFTGLLPGVNMGAPSTFSYNTPSGWGVGFNGQGGFQMMGLMDGGIATFMSGQEYESVPIQAIQEVTVNVSNFGAEYSNGLAVFNVIQKSGTNQFHGEAYEFVQNDKFEARNFFSPSVASLRWNMYGATIGGPIKKDKLFFFFSFQGNPTNSFGFGLASYPTAAMRTGDLSGLPQAFNPAGLVQNPDGTYSNNTPFTGNQITTIDPVAKAIMGYYPMPNQPGFYNNYYYSISSPASKYSYNGKVTYNISSGNRLNLSTYVQTGNSPINLYNGPTCPIDCYSQKTFIHNDVITDVWSITPNTVNEIRAGVLSNHDPYMMGDVGKNWGSILNIPNLTANAFPGISIGGSGSPTTIGNSFKHALLAYASISTGDTLTLVRGKHILKFGGEYNSGRDNQSWGDINPGDFSFTGQFTEDPNNPTATGLGFADFLLGLSGNWSDSWTPAWGSRIGSAQFFGQDDFKVTPKLTLNIGLRWLIQRGITEQYNRLGSFDPTIENPATGTLGAMWYGGQDGRKASEATLWGNFQPRLGFAWAPKNNWSVRGSYGIFDNMWTNTYYGGGIGYGMTVNGYDYTPNSLVPVYSNGQSSSLDVGHTAPAIPSFPPTADFYNGSGVVFYPYHTPMTYIQQWHLSVQHQFKGDVMVELGYVGSRGVHLSDPSDLDQVPESAIQQYGGIGVNMQPYRPYPQYTGINYQAFGGWNNYNGLQLSVKKALSKGLWVLSNYTWSHSLDTNTQNGWIAAESDYQIALSPRSLYGNSQIDARQAWNGGFVYQLPFGQGKTLLNRKGILNGVVGGWQLSNTWQASDGEPFSPLWGGPNEDFSGSGNWYPNRVCDGKVSNPTISEWFNPACFVAAAPGTYGNSGRDILSGPGYFNMNTSFSKSFKLPHLGEQAKLQIRIDATDVLNHANFGSVNTGVTPAPTSAGVIGSAITSRNVQLGARLVF